MSVKFAYILFMVVSGSLTFIQAQIITIPDANFKAFLVTNYDTSGDGEISQTEAEVVTGTLDCRDLGIADLTGIEFFTNATWLNCSRNQLMSLPDLSSLTNLQLLDCHSNQLTSLPDLSALTSLEYLFCSQNELTSLPEISALVQLRSLSCGFNEITSLPDLSSLINLNALYCNSNQLTTLPDLSNLTNLQDLWCYSNQLTSLPDLSSLSNLTRLWCFSNQLTSLPDIAGLTNLQDLYCSSNHLTTLPDVFGFTNLQNLYFHKNDFDFDDCPDIEAIEALNLMNFTYNPQRNGSTLDCNCIPPSLMAHPENAMVCPGDSVAFSVIATGLEPLVYQWRKNELNIPGATSSGLSIDPVGAADAGEYDCVITNDCGSETSNPAILTVNDPVSIAAHPQSEMVCPGDSVVFSVEAIGTAPLSYQWYRDGFVIPDASSADITIDPVSVDDAGEYDCVITNDCGSVTSNPAILTVDGPLGVAVMPSSIAQGLSPLTMEAIISCALPPVSWEWQNLTTQGIFGMNENPVTLGAVLTETTYFEITVMDADETAAAICTVLVSHETLFLDYNGDGCNSIHDLWELAAEWLSLGIDPNGDGFIDVRDFLYINTDDPVNCPE